MEIKGTIKVIGDVNQASEKFKKRDLVITIPDEKYPQHISVQLTQDKVNLLDSMSIGDEVNCFINLRGKEWTSPKGEIRYFNTLECWKIDVIKAVNLF